MVTFPAIAEPLPGRAVITVGSQFVAGDVGGDIEGCRQASTTPSAVRHKFTSFHRISTQTLHDLYDFVDCGVKGDLRVGERSFYWKLYLTDILITNYPDGKTHYLAGKPDLSDRH